eukprot:scaffold55646_cov29-Tisochrysis_lutea.AAC.6
MLSLLSIRHHSPCDATTFERTRMKRALRSLRHARHRTNREPISAWPLGLPLYSPPLLIENIAAVRRLGSASRPFSQWDVELLPDFSDDPPFKRIVTDFHRALRAHREALAVLPGVACLANPRPDRLSPGPARTDHKSPPCIATLSARMHPRWCTIWAQSLA